MYSKLERINLLSSKKNRKTKWECSGHIFSLFSDFSPFFWFFFWIFFQIQNIYRFMLEYFQKLAKIKEYRLKSKVDVVLAQCSCHKRVRRMRLSNVLCCIQNTVWRISPFRSAEPIGNFRSGRYAWLPADPTSGFCGQTRRKNHCTNNFRTKNTHTH